MKATKKFLALLLFAASALFAQTALAQDDGYGDDYYDDNGDYGDSSYNDDGDYGDYGDDYYDDNGDYSYHGGGSPYYGPYYGGCAVANGTENSTTLAIGLVLALGLVTFSFRARTRKV